MTVSGDSWVFDTGPIRHFASEGWFGALRFLADGRAIVVPDVVTAELQEAAADEPALRAVLDKDSVNVVRPDDLRYLASFARFEQRLTVGRKNLGECGVLALAETYGCEIVLDDATPRVLAQESGFRVTATLPILCAAVRAKQLTFAMVEALADDLLSGSYFLPFGPGGFREHVLETGLLEWDELAVASSRDS